MRDRSPTGLIARVCTRAFPSYDHALSCHGPDGEDRVARKSCGYRCVKLGEITGTCSRRRRSGVVFEQDEKQVRDLTTEVTVVGGGPAGLTAAIALASAGVETV